MDEFLYSIDEEGELCIWKGKDERIAFVREDFSKLLIALFQLIVEDKEAEFERIKYGKLKLNLDSNFVRITGSKGTYILNKLDIQNLLSYIFNVVQRGI